MVAVNIYLDEDRYARAVFLARVKNKKLNKLLQEWIYERIPREEAEVKNAGSTASEEMP